MYKSIILSLGLHRKVTAYPTFPQATGDFDFTGNFDLPESESFAGENGLALAHIEQMFASWQDTNGNGGILSTLITSLSAKFPILNYGCYCFLNKDPDTSGGSATFAELPGPMDGHGGAEPLDDLDSLCYELHRYQQCIEMDVAQGFYDNVCTLTDGYYYQTLEATGSGDHACTEEDWKADGSYNPATSFKTLNDCRHAVCMGDRHFSNQVASLYESGSFRRTPAYFAMVQKGTYADNCQVSSTSSGSSPSSGTSGGSGPSTGSGQSTPPFEGVEQCCGFEVDRKPMNTGNAQCCVDSSTGHEYLAGLGDICS